MTHVVNLLPWRDLRRRQRLRYTLLLAIGIVLLAGMVISLLFFGVNFWNI